MSPQKPRSGNKPLVLDELQIPGAALAHPPVEADTWGINIAAARLNFPHDGLKLILPPWTPNMNVGDSYRIKINNFPVVLGSLERPDEVGQEVMRFIAPGGLVDGAFALSYDVTRVGDSTPEPSQTTNIYVKIDAAPPGGRDQDGDEPGHSELRLSIPPQFLPPGAVDKDDAAAGIPVTILPYPNMFDGDRIKLSWGGEIVWHRVTDLEAIDPDNHPIVITVEEATIRDADDTDSSGLVVAFEVYDVVDNQSDDWSAEVRVVVDTGSSRLIAPFIKEVRDMKLDMDELGDADLTFQVVAFTADFATGDQIEMRLSGTTVNGDKVDKPYPPELISNAPSIVEFKRPSADVRALIGGVHTAFSYRLIKADGSPDLFSKTFSPRIIGLSTLLAAPIALDEIAGTLDPDLPRTQVDIPWNDIMVPGNVIMLVWEGTTASGTPYEPDLPLHPITDDEDGNTLEISVEGEHLKAIENGTLDLCYWLLSDAITRAAVGHKSLYAEQLRLGQPQVELPEPVVEGENGGVLDPADVPTTGTRLIVRQYAGQIEEDVVHILWWGSVTGRYRNQIKLNSITDKIDVPFTIRKALVDDNRNGTVQAMYWVKRANGRTSASAVLRMSIGAAMDLSAPSVKQATGSAPSQQLNPVAAKDALTVVIPEYGIKPGDLVRVTWTGTAGAGSHTTLPQELPGNREIDLPVGVVAYNLGQSVTVTYTVTPSGGNESEPSAALTLNVQAIPDISLPMPLIPQAAQGGIGSELDLSTFTGDTRVTVAPWPLIAAGQRVWLRAEGTAIDNSDYTITLYTASEVISPEVTDGLSKALLRSELEKLRDGSTLNVILQVTFDRSSTQANAVDFPLRTYTLKTVALVAPTLTDIRDSKGTVVDKITVETSVTVTGTGSSGQQIQLLDGTANIGSAFRVPDNSTTWNTVLNNLTVKDYSIKAKPLYGTGLPDSAVKGFKVTAVVNPTISDIRDSKGSVVNGATVETSVTVSGTGSSGQQIQLMNGSANIGNPFTIPETGTTWNIPLTGLAPNAYSIKAKALYSTGIPDSAAKGFTVTELLRPEITNVRTASGAEVPNGGVTDQVNVTLFGTASKAQSVEIFDEGAPKGTADVNGSGNWSIHQNGMAPGFHSFTAKGLYGNNPISEAWTINVSAPLVIDTSPMTLNGRAYKTPSWTRKLEAPDNTATRTASGGVQPYTYRSSDPAIASVNDAGFVRGEWNGSATIIVRDSLGSEISYPVNVSNMYEVVFHNVDYPAVIIEWISSIGAVSYTNGGLAREIASLYDAPSEWFYDGETANAGVRRVFARTGETQWSLGFPLVRGIALTS